MSAIDLGQTADDLIDQYDRPLVGSLLVRLEELAKSGDLVVGIRPLKDHPVAALSRFRAPTSWLGIGLVSGGWVAPMEGIRPSAHPDAVRVTQVVLLDREGRVESRIRYPDGSIIREAPAYGVALDALRVALGLPQVA